MDEAQRGGPDRRGRSLRGDDSINSSVCPYWVRKDLGGNRYLIAKSGSSGPRVGNTLLAYRSDPGNLTHDAVACNITIVGNRWRSSGKKDVIDLHNIQGGAVKDHLIVSGKKPIPVCMRNCKAIKGGK